MELETELQELLNKHVPAQLSEVLRKELQSGKDAKVKVEQLTNTYNQERENSLRLSRKVVELEDIISKQKALDERQKEIETKERNLQVTLLQNQLKSSEEKTSSIFLLVETIFKNPVVNKQMFQSGRWNYDEKGNQLWVPEGENRSETVNIGK